MRLTGASNLTVGVSVMDADACPECALPVGTRQMDELQLTPKRHKWLREWMDEWSFNQQTIFQCRYYGWALIDVGVMSDFIRTCICMLR